MSTILCAIDGSEHATRALTFAGKLAKSLDAKLIVLAVVPYGTGRAGAHPLWATGEAQRVLDDAKKVVKGLDVANAHFTTADAHDVADAIISVAAKHEADQIVIGSSGKGAAKRLVLGSVSNAVVNRAEIPVTVVH
jgi:nucleotide-binding universal stress UspA family protein